MQQQVSGLNRATPPASRPVSMCQHYSLRWKQHHNNFLTMFSYLRERETFCDVTLACEGQILRAHKVVLSACSSFFDTIFSQFEEKDPIVIMRDVRFEDMKVLIDYMYNGEINIEHSMLASLLKTAEDLHIKGLADVSWPHDEMQYDVNNSGHSPGGSGGPGVEAVLREGADTEEPPPPKHRRRGRPPLDDPPSAHDVFTPKISCVTGNVGTESTLSVNKQQEEASEGDHESWDDEMMLGENNEAPIPIVSYMPKDDGMSDRDKPSTSQHSNAMNPAIPEQFRDVIKMNDYLTTGRRQEFWEEPFTRRVMDAIKSKELEMKTAAEILGVSYGTLYGRYRDSYGCLKHPYRVRDFWAEPGPAEILAKLRRKEITLFRAAEFLNVTVHTLATYLSTLQGPDRISLAGDLSVAATGVVVPMDVTSNSGNDNNDSMNDILQKINAHASGASTTATTIKREGGGYVELPAVGVARKAATSMLENNPDITIVKTEGMQRKRMEYAKLTATADGHQNNNAKLMSGGAVSEMATSQLARPGQQTQQQPATPQQMVTAQTTVHQQLQQQQHQIHQQHPKLANTLSINNDISKP